MELLWNVLETRHTSPNHIRLGKDVADVIVAVTSLYMPNISSQRKYNVNGAGFRHQSF